MVSTPCARLPHMPLEEQRWRIWHAPPRSRGRSAHGVFSYEERGIPATMQGWGDQWEEEVGKECQRWVVTRDAAGRCEHDSGNIAVFERTLLSMLHSQGDRTLLTGLALGVIAYMDPPGIARQYRAIARRHYDCTHIYGLSGGGHVGLPALMDSALFRLHILTTYWRSVRLAGSGRAGLTCCAMHTSRPTQSSGRSTIPAVSPLTSGPLRASRP